MLTDDRGLERNPLLQFRLDELQHQDIPNLGEWVNTFAKITPAAISKCAYTKKQYASVLETLPRAIKHGEFGTIAAQTGFAWTHAFRPRSQSGLPFLEA